MSERQGAPPRRIDARFAAAFVVVALAVVVAAVAVRGPAWTAASHPGPRQTTAQATVPPPAPAAGQNPDTGQQQPVLPRSSFSGRLMLVVLLVLGLTILAWTATALARVRVRLARRGAPLDTPVPLPSVERAVAEAADRALQEVEQPDAREAVVRSWLLLVAAAAEAGVPASPAETATEYAARLAAQFAVPGAGLARLAALYREARFSAHPVTEAQRAEARDLLQRLRSGLRETAP